MHCRYGLPGISHSAEIEVLSVSRTSPFDCSCGRTFTSTRDYNLHKGNPLVHPPAIMDEHMSSGPLINEERFISNCLNYFTNEPRPVHELKHSVYCLVGVPVNVYKDTTPFNIRTYMTDCLKRKEPIIVYIGKCSDAAWERGYSPYHTDVVYSVNSTVGKSIILQTMEWFHVRSQTYQTAEDAERAEALAQVFVNWRSHISTHHVKYKPGWFRMENWIFQSETTVDEKMGLLKLFKDVENVNLFCTECLNQTCTQSHDPTTQLFYGESLVQLPLFSGNWNVNQTDLLPLRMR
jgi:hypothetical protein